MSYNSKYKGAEVESLLDKVNDMGEIPTKVSQLENDVPYVTEDVASDGVYAVDASGKLIDYNTADSSCLGVALVAGEHKFMITKSNATNDGSGSFSEYLHAYQEYPTNLSLKQYSTVDGTYVNGFLPKADGTYESTPNLSGDFNTWKEGALSDFEGKANTEVLEAASKSAIEIGTVIKRFNQSEQAAGRSADWYVPALGQIALMYLNKSEINAAFMNIGGAALDSGGYGYWSSSGGDREVSWVLSDSGYIMKQTKYVLRQVRFIRDITPTKPLKERVYELETSKQDTIEDLDAIRDGASKGATALQEEQYKGTVTSVKINGVTKNPSNGVVDLGTISGGITSPLYPLRAHTMDDDNVSINPGEYHMWPAPMDSLTISLGGSSGGNVSHWIFRFSSGNNGTTLTLPGGIIWANGK